MEGGRIRDAKGINYPFETIELDPSEIPFDEILQQNGQNIYVLAHQPGIGKTYNVMQYLKKKIEEDNDFTFFYFTDRHKTIQENINEYFTDEEVIHWKGLDKIIRNKKAASFHRDYHLSLGEIRHLPHLRIDKYELSEYYAQFSKAETNRRVFAPFEYLYSRYFFNNLPQVVFLDENISRLVTFTLEPKKAMDALEVISQNEEWKKNLQDHHYGFFKLDTLEEIIKAYRQSVIKAYRDNNKKVLEILKQFNPFEFKEYIRWGSIYGWESLSYSFPLYYYHAFDAVLQGTPLIIMDATFNSPLFSYFLESYNGETRKLNNKGFDDLNVRVFFKIHTNKKSIIYRLVPTSTIPKSNFINKKLWDKSKQLLRRHMRLIFEIFGIDNVGIITFKEIGDLFQAFGFDVEYYGNLRGTNILKDKPVLVIVGTYSPPLTSWDSKNDNEGDNYENLIWRYFMKKIDKKDIKTVEFGAPEEVEEAYPYTLARKPGYSIKTNDGKRVNTSADNIDNDPVSALNMIWYDEIYQAFHRNRGLRSENERIIFAYCWFPEPRSTTWVNNEMEGQMQLLHYDLRKEFTVDKIEEEALEGFFAMLREMEKRGLIRNVIRYLEENPGCSSHDVVRKFRIFKGGKRRGADTIPVTMLRKAVLTIAKEGKYPIDK